MLNKEKSKKVHYIKYAVILPLLAVFLMNFNTREVYINVNDNSFNANSIAKNETEEFLIDSNFSEVKMQKFVAELKTKGFEFILKELKRNDEDQITSIDFEIDKNGVKGKYGINSGYPMPTILIRYKKGNNKIDIKTLEFFNSEELNAKSKNVIEIVLDKNSKIEHLKQLQIKLKENYNVDFNFKLIKKREEDKFEGYSYEFNNNVSQALSMETTPANGKVILKYNPDNKLFSLYIENLDKGYDHGMALFMDKPYGYVIHNFYSNEVLENNKELMKKAGINVEFFNVKRNENNKIIAISIKAKKNDGKITTFKVEGEKPIVAIDILHYESSNAIKFQQVKKQFLKKIIYILDGKEITKDEYKKLNQNDIKSRKLIDIKSATKIYGDKGKNGVLEIKTKEKK